MSMIIFSKIFISEGRGQPVSLKVQIDGCSDHGSNHDMLAGIWKDTLRTTKATSNTCHFEVETTTEIVNQNDCYFVLGERIKQPNEMARYQQDLYVIRASGTSRSLGRIQNDLFSSELFEGSEVNQNSIVLPTSHAKKVVNRLIVGGTGNISCGEEHYHPGSFFRICRPDETSDDLVAPVSHDVAVPCNDTYEGCYPAEMRHVSKATVPIIPAPMRPAKSTNPNAYVAAPNADSVPPVTEENGHETPEDVVDDRNDANAYEEKGSHSLSIDTTPKGIVFTSANTDFHGDERVVMTPLKDTNEYSTVPPSIGKEASWNVSEEVSLTNYHSQSQSPWTTSSYSRGPAFSFNIAPTPVGTTVQATGPQSGVPRESYTVAEEEVFEQEVPPTPIEPKRLHYSTGDGNQERRIDDCLRESVDVEPVEEKSCESNPSGEKVTEAGMDMPLRTQQQCLDKKEEALVIPTLKSSHKPSLEMDKVKPRLYGAIPQQSKQPASVFPGITQQPTNSNCYTSDNRPVQASQQQQQLRSQSIWPGHHPIQQPQQHYYQQYSAYNGIASVPNALGQPTAKYGNFGRERTTTGPNACRSMQSTAFSQGHFMALYPLTKGKVIYAAPRTQFREGSILPLQQLEDDKCELGSGGNGSVFLFKLSKGCFAIKKTEYRVNELQWWSQFDHPNVIPLLAVAIADYYSNCPSKTTCWQVMPQLKGDLSSLVDHGTLESIRDEEPEDSWMMAYSNAKHILKKILCGLEYLHGLGVVHRDIKERNVFYKMCCEHGLPYECTCAGPRKCEVKLGDFDAMTVIRSQSSHVLGTKNYRSPEMLVKECVNSTVDIYAFGCVVIKLVDGRKQYKTESAGICKVVQTPDFHQQQYLQELLNIRFKFENILMSKYDEISAFGKFIKDCINSTPDERPSAGTLLKDPFFDK